MSEVFDLCEGSFKKSMRTVQERLHNKTPGHDSSLCDAIKGGLTDAEEELGKMSIEYSSTHNGDMKTRIDIYKKELQSYKREYQKIRAEVEEQEQANQLFAGAAKEAKGYSQNQKLIEGKRMMYQNLDMNDQISNNLKHQTDVLVGARGKMDIINSQLTVAHKLLNNIKSKLEKNKKTMWFVALLFAVVLGWIIYSYT